MPKYNITMKEPNVLIDSGDPYEIYRHMALWADHYALVYRQTGVLSDYITIERIADDDKKKLHSNKRDAQSLSKRHG